MNNFKERDFFHEGMRHYQDLFDGRRTAEAIEKNRKHYEFWDDERQSNASRRSGSDTWQHTSSRGD